MKLTVLLTFFLFFLPSFLIFINPTYALSINDVASWLSNFFRITGYQIYENETTTTTSTIETTTTMTNATTTTTQETTATTSLPSCPYECCQKGEGHETKVCEYPKNCEKNKCVQPVTTTTPSGGCTDTDGGKIFEVKGTAKDTWGEHTDYCSNDKQITEFYCYDSGDGRGSVVWNIGAVDCQYGCRDGACLPMPTPVCGDKICQGDSEKANCPQDCYVKCSQGSDCGQSVSYKTCDYTGMPTKAKLPDVSYACTVQKRYNCENPGTFDSKCVDEVGASCSPCQYGCKDGECIGGTTPTTTPTTRVCTDSDNGNYYEKGIMKTDQSDTGHTDLCGDSKTLTEYYCENNEARKTTFSCPNGCSDGACLKGETVSEQVTCKFKNSDREQQCYIAGGFSSVDEGTKFCKGKENCIINYKGFKGEKVTWKSSCGEYQYTVQDGNNDVIEFECKSGETTQNSIKNKGFRFAYWQCYDGSESKSEDATSCKTSETWQKYASIFCNGKCTTVGQVKCEGNERCEQKCGVNSFSVWNECYWEELVQTQPAVETSQSTVETAIPTTPVEANATVKTPTQGMLYYFRSDDCPHCIEMDTEIGILKQKGFFNDFGAALFNVNDEISQKYEIRAVPTLILFKDKCSFRKEGFIKSEDIMNWAYQAKCEEQTILVCKDSCPLEGKCYPFGYRKEGKYCSDEGGFKDQLKEEEKCQNNFECSTNVCVNDKCVSASLIQKIIDFFKGLFGPK